jgi:hypothetical protein
VGNVIGGVERGFEVVVLVVWGLDFYAGCFQIHATRLTTHNSQHAHTTHNLTPSKQPILHYKCPGYHIMQALLLFIKEAEQVTNKKGKHRK